MRLFQRSPGVLLGIAAIAVAAFFVQSRPLIAQFAKIASTTGYGSGYDGGYHGGGYHGYGGYGHWGYWGDTCDWIGYGAPFCIDTMLPVKTANPGGKDLTITIGKNTDSVTVRPYRKYKGAVAMITGRLAKHLGQITAIVQSARSSETTAVRLYDVNGGNFQTLVPLGTSYKRGANIKLFDVTGDGRKELIVAPKLGKAAIVYQYVISKRKFVRLANIAGTANASDANIELQTVVPAGQKASSLATLAHVGNKHTVRVWAYQKSTNRVYASSYLTARVRLSGSKIVSR